MDYVFRRFVILCAIGFGMSIVAMVALAVWALLNL